LMLSLAFSTKSSWNETHWNNDRFEELLVSARAELDEIKRQDMYSEMQRLISDEGGLIAPVFANTIDVLSDKLGTPEEISSNMAVDGQRNTERWWFK
jgi:peptide/nickel transport system substrate-binding protein